MRNPTGTSRRDVLAATTLFGATAASDTALSLGVAAPPTNGRISVQDFGAKADGIADDFSAIIAARDEAVKRGAELVFPAGVYRHTHTLELGIERLRVRGEGRVVLHHTGAAAVCVSLDAGDRKIAYGHVLENITIRGSGAPGQVGLFVRNVVHGVRRSIRVRNIAGAAFDIRGDVLSTYQDCVVSQLDDGADSLSPEHAFMIDRSAANSATTACTFVNCIAELGRVTGWRLLNANSCKWVGGTSEGVDGIGILVAKPSGGNSFDGFFMELNKGGDVDCYGSDNEFISCTMTSASRSSPYERIPSAIFRAGAVGNCIRGGRGAFRIAVEKGAESTRLERLECHSIADNGTGTVISDTRQLFNSTTRFPSRTLGNVEDPNPIALDWYREALFRPTLSGMTQNGSFKYGEQSGRSTRIGNVVHIAIDLTVRAVHEAATGPLVVSGLPYVTAPGGRATLLAQVSGVTDVSAAWTSPGKSELTILRADQTGALTLCDARIINPGTLITITGQFFV